MKIDGLMSLQGMYEHAKLGTDFQTGFEEALQRAKEKQSLTGGEPAEEAQKEEQALRKAVQGFEAYFIHQILRQARAGIPSGGLIPESNAKGIYEDMLDEKRAEEMTAVGGFGLTEALMKQLRKK